jgi:CrcB protein
MITLLNLAAVATGGAVGSVARHGITVALAAVPGGSTMLGTTISNVLGCAAIGAFAQYVTLSGHVAEHIQLAIRVGFLGGMTTFSAFALESTVLAETGRLPLSAIYVLANLLLSWAALILTAMLVRGWMT